MKQLIILLLLIGSFVALRTKERAPLSTASSVCTSRAASHVLSLSPHERSSLLHVLSLSLLDVQLSSLREEFTDYRSSGRNRPGFKSTADPDHRDLCSA